MSETVDHESEAMALSALEDAYAFIYARVGNRADAEDVTQQVALKALPRLREGAAPGEVRGYVFATARSMLAAFWSARYRLPEAELDDDLADDRPTEAPNPSPAASEWLERTLAALPRNYRTVLELRFLQGSSIREVAHAMGKTEGAVKVMQLRALRAAASATTRPAPTLPARRRLAAAPGSASGPRPGLPAF